MVKATRKPGRIILLGCLLTVFAGAAAAQDSDPPSRVIRLNQVEGNVSMEPAGVDDWAPAVVNRPFYVGDYLYADEGSRAEMHTDIAAIRLGAFTNIGILNLTDNAIQIELTQGDLEVTVHDFDQYQAFEIDTPNAAVTLLRAGVYRIHVDPNANTSWMDVRSGQSEITGGGQAFTLNPGSRALMSGTDNAMSYNIQATEQPDAFDEWALQRDDHFAHRESARYLPPTTIGSEDLDDYGNWQASPEYGDVWYPTSTPVGWAPYHTGHWAWIAPWGWTWVDDAPWGFAPFHYGRWVYARERWGWAPGPMALAGGPRIRPCYAPALVAWFGGSHFGVSLTAGRGPEVGWVPLGYGEVYTPAYHVSPRYFSTVNVNNTRIVNRVNITNVYNNVYVNKTVYNQTYMNVRAPNAVVSMPQNALANGRPVAQSGAYLRPNQLARFQPRQAAVLTPAVLPTRQAVSPTSGAGRAMQPSARALARPVIANRMPPPAGPSFAARQSYLQQHIGQPVNFAAMRRDATPPPQTAALIRQAPPARPVNAMPGQHLGAPAAQGNPGFRNNVPAANGNLPRPEVAAPHGALPAGPQGTSPAGHGVPPGQGPRPNQMPVPQNQPARNQPAPNPPAGNQPAPAGSRYPGRPNQAPQVNQAPQPNQVPRPYQVPQPNQAPRVNAEPLPTPRDTRPPDTRMPQGHGVPPGRAPQVQPQPPAERVEPPQPARRPEPEYRPNQVRNNPEPPPQRAPQPGVRQAPRAEPVRPEMREPARNVEPPRQAAPPRAEGGSERRSPNPPPPPREAPHHADDKQKKPQ